MSKPTLRRDIERRLRYAIKYKDAPFEKTCRLALFALDMRDKIAAYDDPALQAIVEKFDGASNEQKSERAKGPNGKGVGG